MKNTYLLLCLSLSFVLLTACNTEKNDVATAGLSIMPKASVVKKEPIEVGENNYWYNNEAEISSYTLKQARYGEVHEGTAVLVFVTEPFSIASGTKADNPTDKDVSVLKLNFTKKFNTGIYPYSMMMSTFFPFSDGENSLKISMSSQEWCGHTFLELKNNRHFDVKIDSYFEGVSGDVTLEKHSLEDDFWSMIRLSPKALPTGKFKVIPSFFYLGLMHKDIKAYNCELSLDKIDDKTNTYVISYPELERKISINYENDFPHRILSWEETYVSGWGKSKKELTTSGTLIKTIKTDYWNKHSNKDAGLRTELGLSK